MTDAREPCCRDESNLYEAERKRVPDGVFVTRRCRVCNRRHFLMLADPKHVGVGG